MKFDDRLTTVLRDTAPTGQAAVAQYRQIIDILGQTDAAGPEVVAAGLARIHGLHPHISPQDRLVAVRSLTGRLRSPVLLRYLAEDRPDIANASILAARLTDRQWADLIPDLPIRARGFLRNRRDLGPLAQQVLAAYGPGDMRLSSDAPTARDEPVQVTPPGKEIGQIVARIEAFRKSRSQAEPQQLPLGDEYAPVAPEPAQMLQFATDVHGSITHTDSAHPAALFGLSIARVSQIAESGVDGYAAAAFRQRMPMTAARLEIAGAPAVSGSWRIDAQPRFDSDTGRFTGYEGRIRRPDASEMPARAEPQQSGDEIRQLIHELRTPLNAIMGFSEIIEQQLFGPAAQNYRAMAAQIGQDARFLLAGFDDLDTALKLDTGHWHSEPGTADRAWLLQRIEERMAPLCAARGVSLLLEPDAAFAGVDMAPADAERVILRLLSTMAGLMGPAETATVRILVAAGRHDAEISVNLPLVIGQEASESLLDPDFGSAHDAGNAPLMGIGFSLRLVRSLAQNHGGELQFHPDRIGVRLPHLAIASNSGEFLSAV